MPKRLAAVFYPKETTSEIKYFHIIDVAVFKNQNGKVKQNNPVKSIEVITHFYCIL